MLRQIIIVGGGRVGRHSAAKLTDDGFMVTVIEKDPAMCEQFPNPLAGRVIEGDGTELATLEEANAETADIVVALTDDVQTNLSVCELASEIAPDAETHLRIDDDGQEAYAHLDHVDHIVYPAALAAQRTVKQISKPVS
ncbi:potassium channel family protein [Halovenus sp. HT40]|uniref:potassium channel family protein n=1 Tax=Halovenus sp. HT40 TaxID=3126691 RepID=UPI00300EC366